MNIEGEGRRIMDRLHPPGRTPPVRWDRGNSPEPRLCLGQIAFPPMRQRWEQRRANG